MRSRALAAVLATGLASLGACASADRPHHFASPMLGVAQVPPAPLPGDPPRPRAALANRASSSGTSSSTRRADAIRVATAPPIREASAAAAAEVADAPAARLASREQLASPHRIPRETPLPTARTLDDLRRLVGRRDARDPIAIVLGWAADLAIPVEGTTPTDLLAWAERTRRLVPLTTAQPGDLLVFDHVVSDQPADLVALVLSRDDRGVVELLYAGGGIIRRGFVDPSRPSVRRDGDGRVVNTFMRHGRRWPSKGTRYLAGELLSAVIRPR